MITERPLAASYLDDALGDQRPVTVTPMAGGGSCEVFALDRGDVAMGAAARTPPRQLGHRPRRAARVPHPRRDQGRAGRASPDPSSRCDDPEVFGAPVLRHGAHRRAARSCSACPSRGRPRRRRTGGRSRSSSTRSSRSMPSTGNACGLGDMAHAGDYLVAPDRRAGSTQLDSYGGRDLPAAHADRRLARTRTARPISRARCATATTSSTTCCSRPSRRRGCSPSSTGRWPRSATRWSTWRGR